MSFLNHRGENKLGRWMDTVWANRAFTIIWQNPPNLVLSVDSNVAAGSALVQ